MTSLYKTLFPSFPYEFCKQKYNFFLEAKYILLATVLDDELIFCFLKQFDLSFKVRYIAFSQTSAKPLPNDWLCLGLGCEWLI